MITLKLKKYQNLKNKKIQNKLCIYSDKIILKYNNQYLKCVEYYYFYYTNILECLTYLKLLPDAAEHFFEVFNSIISIKSFLSSSEIFIFNNGIYLANNTKKLIFGCKNTILSNNCEQLDE